MSDNDNDSLAPSISDGSDIVSKSSAETHSNSNTSRTNAGDSVLAQPMETKLVRSSKACVYVFLLVVAIGGSFLTWLFLKEEEQISLTQQFDILAEEILAVSSINAYSIFSLYEAEALQMTTNAMSSGQEWPFFSLPEFEAEADLLINQTKTGQYMALIPIVLDEERGQWETYTLGHQGWINGNVTSICPVIHDVENVCVSANSSPGKLYAPVWQIAPGVTANLDLVNVDAFAIEGFTAAFDKVMANRTAVISEAFNLDVASGNPESLLVTPIFQLVDTDSPIVAVISAVIPWNDYFENLLPEGEDGIVVVVSNEQQQFTYEINGPSANYLGPGDLHDPTYESFVASKDFGALGEVAGVFGFTLSVYPTEEFETEHTENHPRTYTLAVAFVFLFATSVFLVYDFFVERRQTQVMITASKSSAIVNSLFPANVRDRLMEEQAAGSKEKANAFKASTIEVSKQMQTSKPIADLFAEATVMFADIAGFTAWSSLREPSQVFVLLETVYNAFDKIARKMKVFKVETIGDSYVAVAGLPNPQPDHAEIMARFAHKCLVKMNTLVHDLEMFLGPGTSELKMRVGLHSGPVTAGVLRGEKSRFQLFGDTVNTAARMESTGVKNRIQLSKETADLLVAAGKEHLIRPRANTVFAKGKGELQTFWYIQGAGSDVSESDEGAPSSRDGYLNEQHRVTSVLKPEAASVSDVPSESDTQTQRLVLWNVENLSVPLKKLIAKRNGQKVPDMASWRKLKLVSRNQGTVLDEVEEVISMTEQRVADLSDAASSIVLDDVVVKELTNFVATIASMHRPNAFHSFDHASHVAQSVTKLLSRVVTPDQICYDSMSYAPKAAPHVLHNFTFGIASDPLIHFSVILAALIHDCDHPGVPNATLVKECDDMAKTYGNKSVAEQNSVDLAWNLLMEPAYENLRRCIYATQEELESFRKIVVNAVLATDVVDKELGALRKKRWELAFNKPPEDGLTEEEDRLMTNRKATIVIEYMIQASDVSHTMQHWQIYTHWNEKFFQECWQAFQEGRADKDPAESWYQGELGFFDFYVIPLAKRLKECGVFGVSGDEYTSYAIQNREEWSRRGKAMIEQYKKNLPSKA